MIRFNSNLIIYIVSFTFITVSTTMPYICRNDVNKSPLNLLSVCNEISRSGQFIYNCLPRNISFPPSSNFLLIVSVTQQRGISFTCSESIDPSPGNTLSIVNTTWQLYGRCRMTETKRFSTVANASQDLFVKADTFVFSFFALFQPLSIIISFCNDFHISKEKFLFFS